MSFFQNTCKPEGLGGKLMVHMMNSGHGAMAEWGFGHIQVQKKDHCLDIGCGGRANVKRLLEMASEGKAAGIDYSEVSVEKSAKLNREAIQKGSCQILHGNVMELPFKEQTFQVITAFETIYFWPDLLKAFEQVYRVLKNDGIFMICNECSGENPKDEKWERMVAGMKIYTRQDLLDLLKKAGFRELRTDQNEKGWICIVGKK